MRGLHVVREARADVARRCGLGRAQPAFASVAGRSLQSRAGAGDCSFAQKWHHSASCHTTRRGAMKGMEQKKSDKKKPLKTAKEKKAEKQAKKAAKS